MANKGSFTTGDPRAGRRAGSLNKTSKDARELAQRLLSDPEYLDGLKERLKAGKAGDLERVLWAYAFGPPSSHPVSAIDDFFD